jgi:hypothetical protein
MATAAPVQEKEAATGQKPVEVIRLRGVSASIFENHAKKDGRDMIFHKVNIQRAFKVGEEWKHSASFGRDDLPLLKRVADLAWAYILDAEASRGKDDDAE